MNKLPGELETINVIVMERGYMKKVRSFPNTEDGVTQAKIAFHDEIVEWHKLQGKDAPMEEAIEAATENGYFDCQGHWCDPAALEVFLTHSA